MNFKNKNFLITAGPTWVPIDSVRVISNTASGETGILLAQRLSLLGARVSLLLGPVQACCLDRRIRLIPFKFFDELKECVIKELKTGKFDAVIHSAAVSDYQPRKPCPGKIKSGLKKLRLSLIPTIKILDLFKKIDGSLTVVAFKFEPASGKGKLIKAAKSFLRHGSADFVVANTVLGGRYQAYLLDGKSIEGPVYSKGRLADKLIRKIGETYGCAKNR